MFDLAGWTKVSCEESETIKRDSARRGEPQYAVIYFPDLTLNVRAVGPFRSRARADEALARIEAALDLHDIDQGPSRLPSVVEMLTIDEAIELDALPDLEGSDQ